VIIFRSYFLRMSPFYESSPITNGAVLLAGYGAIIRDRCLAEHAPGNGQGRKTPFISLSAPSLSTSATSIHSSLLTHLHSNHFPLLLRLQLRCPHNPLAHIRTPCLNPGQQNTGHRDTGLLVNFNCRHFMDTRRRIAVLGGEGGVAHILFLL